MNSLYPKKMFISIATICILLNFSKVLAIEGYGTAYADGGSLPINACQYPKDKYEGEHWSHFYAAVDYRRWDGGSVCGKCAKVTGAAGTHIVKIVDYCAKGWCGENDLDFSKTALKAITGYEWDIKPISWEWTECDQDATAVDSRKDEMDEESFTWECNEWMQTDALGPGASYLVYKKDCSKELVCKFANKKVTFKADEEVDKDACEFPCGQWIQRSNLGKRADRLVHLHSCTSVLVCKNGDKIRFTPGQKIDVNAC